MVGSGFLRPDLKKLRDDTPEGMRALLERCIDIKRENRPLFVQVCDKFVQVCDIFAQVCDKFVQVRDISVQVCDIFVQVYDKFVQVCDISVQVCDIHIQTCDLSGIGHKAVACFMLEIF